MCGCNSNGSCGCGSIKLPQGAQGPQGVPGTGVSGADGVGISSATVNGSGDLIIVYTDGSTTNAGAVVGPTGANGSAGNKFTKESNILAVDKSGFFTGDSLTVTQSEVASSGLVLADIDYVATLWYKAAGSQLWIPITIANTTILSNYEFNTTSGEFKITPKVNGAYKLVLLG